LADSASWLKLKWSCLALEKGEIGDLLDVGVGVVDGVGVVFAVQSRVPVALGGSLLLQWLQEARVLWLEETVAPVA
jgi:hypothetical protein